MKKVFTLFALLLTVAAAALAQSGPAEIPDVTRDKVICFTMYTVQNGVLKMTAQLYPLRDGEDRSVRLEVRRDGAWTQIATAPVVERGWTALFRVENWDASRDVEYRVAHGPAARHEGRIRRDPVDKDVIVVAAFTGNSTAPEHGGELPKTDIVENIKKIDPDLLFFSGDQVYNHFHHYSYWLRFGRDFGEIMRDRPTVCVPDDHDVGQANLWGEGGKKSSTIAGSDGGYFQDVEYVQEVERAQAAHLPDPYDPAPVERGIGVYYTALNVGRVSFAIIEDRKFKTGPEGKVPFTSMRPDLLYKKMNPKKLDVKGAELLGERQLAFLREWAADWRGADMKAVLSATIFVNAATHHGGPSQFAYADFDSNGWPRGGRDAALREIRKGFAFMLAGDQHLGTLIHHGVDDWNDAGWSFSVPSIANYYLRYWMPEAPGLNREPGAPEHTGEFIDGFGNKFTMAAVGNPDIEAGDDTLGTRAAGFGVVRFDTRAREITVECLPRNKDAADPRTKQYPGWPRTIAQENNYGRKAAGRLPTVNVTGMTNPVAQVIDEATGEIVYTIRMNGSSFTPKVFAEGTYTLKIGEQPGRMKTISNLKAPADPGETIEVAF